MPSTSTSAHPPLWLFVLVPLLALVILSPIIGLLFAGLALTVGFAAVAIKFGVLAIAVWAVLRSLKSLFGSRRPTLPPSQMTIDVTPIVELDSEPELEHRDPDLREPPVDLDPQFAHAPGQDHVSPN